MKSGVRGAPNSAALRESLARYRGIFQSLRISLWEEDCSAVIDLLDELREDGVTDLRAYLGENPQVLADAIRRVRVLDVNDYSMELFDAERKELLLSGIAETFLPETERIFTEELAVLWEGGRSIESETVLQTLSGRRIDVLVSIAFEGARCERTLVTLVDITGRNRAGLTRQKLAAVVESSDDAILSIDLDGRIVSWNAGAKELLGYEEHEVIGEPTTLLMPEDLREKEARILERIRNGERVRHYETARRHKDGTLIDVSLTVSPVTDTRGRVVGASKIARDITDRKRSERALREQRERLAKLNHIAKSISSNLDLDTVVQTVTDVATELSGAKFGAFFYNVTGKNGESFQLYTLSGAPREAFDKFGLPRNTAVFEPTFRGTSIVRSDDITADPRYGRNTPHRGMPEGHLPVVSYLAVPVVSRSGDVLGGLFFGHPERGVFTRESERMVAGIAAHAAIAIDNARLHEAAQREIEQRRHAEESRELLLMELKHRANNTLATIQAISAQTFSDAPEQHHEAFSGRLQALAAAHDVLTGEVEQSASLNEIVQQAIAPFRRDGDLRISVTGPSVQLVSDRALALAVALHELATNAVKYGALSNGEGRVEIAWTEQGAGADTRLRLEWREIGGPPVVQPARRGFGTRLVELSFGGEAGGTHFDFAPTGLVCTLEFARF